jgi:hypothetical protein
LEENTGETPVLQFFRSIQSILSSIFFFSASLRLCGSNLLVAVGTERYSRVRIGLDALAQDRARLFKFEIRPNNSLS